VPYSQGICNKQNNFRNQRKNYSFWETFRKSLLRPKNTLMCFRICFRSWIVSKTYWLCIFYRTFQLKWYRNTPEIWQGLSVQCIYHAISVTLSKHYYHLMNLTLRKWHHIFSVYLNGLALIFFFFFLTKLVFFFTNYFTFMLH
jgi:hypothetical protein